MSKTRKVFIWIVSLIGIAGIGVCVYAYTIDEKTLSLISAVISILMGVIGVVIALIPLDEPKLPQHSTSSLDKSFIKNMTKHQNKAKTHEECIEIYRKANKTLMEIKNKRELL